jgi:hypothetical protein
VKDWTGNATSIYATHGASNHSDTDRAILGIGDAEGIGIASMGSFEPEPPKEGN